MADEASVTATAGWDKDLMQTVITQSKNFSVDLLWAVVIFVLGLAASKIIINILKSVLGRTKIDTIIQNFLVSIAKAAMLLLIFIAVLKKLGFDTNSLVALIGAAGLAIGLSLQSSLQNFAAGFMLIVFKPFKDGDFVEVAGATGVVEKINIFSTTLLSGDNKEITVSNSAIYGGTITNYTRRDTRRIDLTIGISYDSDMKKAKDLLQKIVNEEKRVLKEPAPVIAVAELADSSVNLVVRPWVSTADYWAVRFDMTEKIKSTFDANGIVIPFPQMHVHLKKLD